jgi:O-antigen/teichoic acid export membrane protein
MWTFSAQFVLLLIQIATISTLARILTPEDYGLVGLLSAVIAVLGLFREMGLAMAIVQRPNVEQGELTRIFWVTLLLGLSLLLLTALCGLGAAWAFDEPRLRSIAPWFGLCFLLNSLESVPGALLRRNLRFKTLSIRNVIGGLLGFLVALAVAMAGYGYKALVVQAVAVAALQLLFTWSAVRWKPTGPLAPWKAIRPYLGFGAAFTGSNIASYLTQNIDSLLIGKIFGYQELGYYSRAKSLMIQPMNQFMAPISTVLLPVFCRMQNDQGKFRKAIATLSLPFLILPSALATWMLVGSEELVGILLGSKWDSTVPIFRGLSASIMYIPFGGMLYLILVSSGRTRLLLHWTWTGALVIIGGYSVGAYFGSFWVAVSFSATGIVLRVPLALYFCGKTGLIDRRQLALTYLVALSIFAALTAVGFYARIIACGLTSNPFFILAIIALPAGAFLAFAFALHPLGRQSFSAIKQAIA